MNAPSDTIALPALLTPMNDGYFAGLIRGSDERTALILPPKAERELGSHIWIARGKSVPGALSLYDGYANTVAMAKAGSKIAEKAIDLGLYIPAQDELELLYRATKPTKEKNSLYGRSGINVSAVPPTYPYTADFPVQTSIAAFQKGGAEAISTDDWYWSSTQHAGNVACAWCQHFSNGYQNGIHKGHECLVVLVRREAI